MTNVEIDNGHQLDLFSPERFGEKEVHIIGCGATGSPVAFMLAKMGVQNLHLWDSDTVENHNLSNQMFRLKDVGRPKVSALAEIIEEATGIVPTLHNEAVVGEVQLSGIVFLLVDTVSARKNIWEGSLKLKTQVEFMIETRMDIDNGRLYAIRPFNSSDIRFWEETFYSDEESEESPCMNRSIMPTVGFMAGLAVWKLIKFFNAEQYHRELIVLHCPTTILNS